MFLVKRWCEPCAQTVGLDVVGQAECGGDEEQRQEGSEKGRGATSQGPMDPSEPRSL